MISSKKKKKRAGSCYHLLFTPRLPIFRDLQSSICKMTASLLQMLCLIAISEMYTQLHKSSLLHYTVYLFTRYLQKFSHKVQSIIQHKLCLFIRAFTLTPSPSTAAPYRDLNESYRRYTHMRTGDAPCSSRLFPLNYKYRYSLFGQSFIHRASA